MNRRGFLNRCLNLGALAGLGAWLGGCAPTVKNYSLPQPRPGGPTVERIRQRLEQSRSRPSWRPPVTEPIPSYAKREWLPPARVENKSRWEGILIHHSASDAGDAAAFDAAHRHRGWDMLGYDFVVNNGNNDHGIANGVIEVGPRWIEQIHGAHCRVDPTDSNYWNEHYIGICLVGNFEQGSPSRAQYQSLARLVAFLKQRYHIPDSHIMGHRDVPGARTLCPGGHFSWYEFRRYLEAVRG